MQADQIRNLKGVETSIQTAARYGVTESNVRLIQDGKTWNRVRKNAFPLTPEQVRKIKLLAGTRPQTEIAAIVGTHPLTVWRVLRGAYADIT